MRKDLEAILQIYQNEELRSVRFGSKQDAIPAMIVLSICCISSHLAIYCYYLHTGQLTKWIEYTASNSSLVGVLMFIWVICYQMVSWMLYWQFEKDEVFPAEDFYMEGSGFRQVNPLVLAMPDDRIAIGLPLDIK